MAAKKAKKKHSKKKVTKKAKAKTKATTTKKKATQAKKKVAKKHSKTFKGKGKPRPNNLKNTFADDPGRAREAGRKSKRGPSMRSSLLRVMEGDAAEDVIKQFMKVHKFKPSSRQKLDLVNAALFGEAVRGNTAAIKEIREQIDGKLPEKVEQVIKHKMKPETVRDIENAILRDTRNSNRK